MTERLRPRTYSEAVTNAIPVYVLELGNPKVIHFDTDCSLRRRSYSDVVTKRNRIPIYILHVPEVVVNDFNTLSVVGKRKRRRSYLEVLMNIEMSE